MGFKRLINCSKTEYKEESYEAKIDYAIAHALSKFGKMGYRQTKRMIDQDEILGHVITYDTFDRHLKRMVQFGQVIKDDKNWKRGKELKYSLHPRSIQALRLGLFEPVKLIRTRRGIWINGISKKQKEIRNYLFILFLMVTIPLVLIGDPSASYGRVTVDQVKAAIGKGHAFGYTKMTRSHIERILQKLEVEGVVSGEQRKEMKFYFMEGKMESFIRELFIMLDNVVLPRIEISLKNTEKASYQVRNFYEAVYGKKNANRHFGKFSDTRSRYKTMQISEKNRILIEVRKRMENLDYNIYDYIKNLKYKYAEMITDQPFLTEAFINVICPPVYGKVSDGKSYPKLAIATNFSRLMWKPIDGQ